MEIPIFEIVKGDRVVLAKSAVAIRNSRYLLADGVRRNGSGANRLPKIRVTDENYGAIVILTGVATARLHAGTTIFSTPLFLNPALSA